MQEDPSQGSTWGGTCGLGHDQAREALVPILIGTGCQRGHRSRGGMAASLVPGWNVVQLPSLKLVRMFFSHLSTESPDKEEARGEKYCGAD